jgi:hypothetical protein
MQKGRGKIKSVFSKIRLDIWVFIFVFGRLNFYIDNMK